VTQSLQSVRQKIEIPFQYTAGSAVTRFLEGLKDKKIVVGVCSNCGRRSVPPLSVCGRCWKPVTDFVPLSGRGKVISFSRANPTTIYGLIQLEGSDSSLVHYVAENPNLAIGCDVVPTWREERTASILDIHHFVLL
jgi:uncharacterized OB-fold protein